MKIMMFGICLHKHIFTNKMWHYFYLVLLLRIFTVIYCGFKILLYLCFFSHL